MVENTCKSRKKFELLVAWGSYFIPGVPLRSKYFTVADKIQNIKIYNCPKKEKGKQSHGPETEMQGRNAAEEVRASEGAGGRPSRHRQERAQSSWAGTPRVCGKNTGDNEVGPIQRWEKSSSTEVQTVLVLSRTIKTGSFYLDEIR